MDIGTAVLVGATVVGVIVAWLASRADRSRGLTESALELYDRVREEHEECRSECLRLRALLWDAGINPDNQE